jgi:peptidylprolyl isomerase domain and WD repeat-containing protein 1
MPVSLSFSSDGTQFVTMSKDRQVRLFKFLTGKIYRKYDESLAQLNKLQKVTNWPQGIYMI